MNLKKLSIIILLVATLSLLSIVPVNAAVKNVAFDSEYYANSYADIKAAFGNDADAAYNHFVNIGIKEGRVASPVFDVVTYVLYYPDLQAAFGTDYAAAYNHFISTGVNEGRLGSAEFNVNAYLANYPDLKEAFGTDYAAAFNHFVNVGVNEGRIADVLVPGATAPEEHAHDYSVFVDYVIEPTCTRDGEAQYACSICGENAPETVTVAKSEDFHEWKETANAKNKEATCQEDGLQYYICTICKETKSEVVPASDAYHQYGTPTVIAGQNVYECSICHYLKKEVINCDHNYEVVRNTATCTEPGIKTSLCTKCQDVKTEEVEATGHTLDTDPATMLPTTRITKQKTCTTDGEATGICTVCKKSIVKVIPASHNYGTADLGTDRSQPATCEEDGIISKICLDCGDQIYEVVKAKGHTEPTDKSQIKYYKVSPVFDSEGAVTDYAAYEDENELEDFSKMTKSEINQILCDYGIAKVFECANVDNEEEYFEACGEEAQVIFYEYVGHKYVTTVDPTCEQPGTKVCSVCGEEVTLPFLGHDFTGNEVTSDGKSICNRCHEVETVTVEKLAEEQPEFNSEKTSEDENESAVIERMKAVTISEPDEDNVITITQNTAFSDESTHNNCFCILLDLGILSKDVEVVGDNYTIEDADRRCASEWATGAEAYNPETSTEFLVWLSPIDFEADGTYSITFRDGSDANSYPVTVTFKYVPLAK